MLHLIKTDPEHALAQSVPARWRRDLPRSITRHFEERVDGRGSFTVRVATDFERSTREVFREAEIDGQIYAAFPFGWRKSQMSQTSIPIHGIAIENQLAMLSEPIRLLEPEEVEAAGLNPSEEICGVSGKPADSRQQPVAADTGGRVRFFCGADHYRLVNEQWLAEEGEPGGGRQIVLPDAWTQGTKSVLYMRVNFPDDFSEPISEADAYNVMAGVNSFFTEGSYNTTALVPVVTPLMTLPHTKGYYSAAGAGALLSDARQAARDAGFETANYDRDIVAHTGVPGFDWGGLASVGGKGVWLQSTGVGVTAHELGHNWGLWHANWWDTTANNGVVGSGTHVEYGNVYDTMGAASAGANQFNTMHKWRLDWLPNSYVHNVTSNGVYRLYAFDVPFRTAGHLLAARFKKDWQRDYWIEFRQRFPGNPWLVHGVMLNWDPWEFSEGGTHLLDTTPGTPTASAGRQDAAVVVGRTFSDLPSGVHITPVARGGASVNSWMDVNVNLGSFPSNRPPTLQISTDQTNATPGLRINFRADATDPDGDTLAYHWEFGDLTFSTNNGPITFKTWAGSGDQVVRCVVSDMKGGSTSANLVIRVGTSPAGVFRVSGRVTDTNGVPVECVRVDNSQMDDVDYVGGYTDSQGYYTIVGVPADTALNAFKYGYVFSPDPTNLVLQADVEGVDFSATPLTAVNIAATTNTVSEPNGNATFILTRSDTNLDLEVTLYRSGTATIGSDYTLLPLQGGTNFYFITIPAGSNTFELPLQVRDDSSSEGPETVTLTLAEGSNSVNYIVSSLGEAAVTILDDDTPTLPSVSVTATTSAGDNSAPESGLDSGRFIFTRTGSAANDITVNYAVSGSATPDLDYEALPGVVIIPSGQSSASVEFQTIDDTRVETNETVIVAISPNPAYNVTGSSTTVRIIDDDLLTVTITPTGGGAAEPSTTGRFTVTRAGDLVPNLLVNYTVGGTATGGVDYVALSGTVTIPAGATTANITVTPIEDTLVEGDESVIVSLAPDAGYNAGSPGNAAIFIRDNERPTVSVSVSDGEASEPGSDTARFRVSRGSISNGNLTVQLAVTGSALPGYDYIPLDNFVTIPDGASFVNLLVTAFDDLHKEETETVILTLMPNANYVFSSGASARVEILDDDLFSVPAVGFALSASGAPESRYGGVVVSLSTTSSAPVTVDYQVFGGAATGGGVDYTLPNGTLTIDAGVLADTLPLTIINDNTVESNETIRIVLSNPIGATHDGNKFHTYTILDDDSGTVTLNATVATALEAGPVSGNFRLTRTGSTNSDLAVFVDITGTAGAPADYQPIGKPLVIPAGASFLNVPVAPVDDATVEITETVIATLTSAPGAKLGSSDPVTVMIVDNDTDNFPVVSVVSSNEFAAESGSDTGEFTISRSGDSSTDLTVHYTFGGTASNGLDYVLTNLVTIPAGQTSIVVTLTPLDDSLVEGDETAILHLTVRDTYRVGAPAEATVIVFDNDQNVRVEVSDAFAAEPGPETGEFSFIRFGTTNSDLTVFFVVSGTAGNGTDYVTITNSIVIQEGDAEARLLVMALDDYLHEKTETVIVTLLTDSAYALAAPNNGTVMLYDNEPTVRLLGTATNASENGEAPGILAIDRGGDPEVNLEVFLGFSGTATFGVDYPGFKTNICMPVGVMSAVITIAPTNELMLEGEETVFARILPSPATYTILAPSNATVTIEDAATNHFPIAQIISPKAETIYTTVSDVGVILEAIATDDDPANTNLTFLWEQISGPTNMFFGDPATNNTTANFTNVGVYVLRVAADDGDLRGFDFLTVVVDSTNVFTPELLHWSFDEGAGTNALDATASGRDGLISGASWITNGVRGNALSFDGSSFVQEISVTNFLDGLNALSISLWINTSAMNSEIGVFTADTSGGASTTLALWQGDFGSCRGISNLIQAKLTTTAGEVRYISSRRFASNQWQHVALVWTNGQPLTLYLNGEIDAAASATPGLEGVLTNCPQFIVGRGSDTNYWSGALDDLRLYSRPLDIGEVKALMDFPPTNYVPAVDAGEDLIVQLIATTILTGAVADDGLPIPPALTTNEWSFVAGPGAVTISDPTNLTTEVSFSVAGSNVFRLMADDSIAKMFDDVIVTVTEPTTVDVFPSDSEAAELGPDEGQFMFTRSGDTNFDIAVQFVIGGIASNGMDYVTITNVIMLPADTNAAFITIRPFLEDRTEGDEPVTLTILPALAYTIGNPEATVTIHDSPFGVWTVDRFTLEELTDPTLSGEASDFDHDGLVNFVEYAFDRDPKVPETNSPMAVAIELDPGDNQSHITLTYQRRVQPTDVLYAVYISNDLLIWQTGTEYVEELLVTPDPNGFTETVKARIVASYTLTTNQFLTISVWRLPQP